MSLTVLGEDLSLGQYLGVDQRAGQFDPPRIGGMPTMLNPA